MAMLAIELERPQYDAKYEDLESFVKCQFVVIIIYIAYLFIIISCIIMC